MKISKLTLIVILALAGFLNLSCESGDFEAGYDSHDINIHNSGNSNWDDYLSDVRDSRAQLTADNETDLEDDNNDSIEAVEDAREFRLATAQEFEEFTKRGNILKIENYRMGSDHFTIRYDQDSKQIMFMNNDEEAFHWFKNYAKHDFLNPSGSNSGHLFFRDSQGDVLVINFREFGADYDANFLVGVTIPNSYKLLSVQRVNNNGYSNQLLLFSDQNNSQFHLFRLLEQHENDLELIRYYDLGTYVTQNYSFREFSSFNDSQIKLVFDPINGDGVKVYYTDLPTPPVISSN